MILSDEDLEQRLNSEDNITKIIVSEKLNDIAKSGNLQVVPVNPNIGNRGNEIPAVVRQMIAACSIGSSETQKEVAETFNVTQPFVSQVSRGMVDSRLDRELVDVTNKTRAQKADTAHSQALDALVGSLDIVNKNLDGITSVKEAAKLAVSMSRVVSVLGKNMEDTDKPRTLVIIKNVPNQKQEAQFEVIDV